MGKQTPCSREGIPVVRPTMNTHYVIRKGFSRLYALMCIESCHVKVKRVIELVVCVLKHWISSTHIDILFCPPSTVERWRKRISAIKAQIISWVVRIKEGQLNCS